MRDIFNNQSDNNEDFKDELDVNSDFEEEQPGELPQANLKETSLHYSNEAQDNKNNEYQSESLDEDEPKEPKSNKTAWYIVIGAAAAVIVVILVFVIMPMTRQPERVKRDKVTPEPAVSAAASAEPIQEPELVEEIIPPEQTEATKEILPELASLYAQNPYLAGWLEIPDTVIDYPVMFTPDDGEDGEYYLYRTFDNEEDPTKEGCLFIDANCTIDPRSTNLLIHGHNMKNGTMFHSLLDYESEEYYKEHPKIYYSSLWEEGEYEIVAVFRSKIYNKDDDVFKYYKFFNAQDEQQFNDFINNVKELALYDTGVDAQYGDELITLATCEYTQENGRFVVVARKKAA